MLLLGVYTPIVTTEDSTVTKDDKSKAGNSSTGLDLRTLAECRECTCFNLRKATRVVTQLFDDSMRSTGLRSTQFVLLVHTHAMGPITLSKLSEAMVTDRTTLARNIELLEKNGLIEARDGDDRRTRIVSITEKGRKKLAEAFPCWRKTQDEVKKLMGQDAWAAMISQTSLLVNRIQER